GRPPRKHVATKFAGKSSKAAIGNVKKPHRFRPGRVALRQTRRYQRSIELLISRLPFRPLVRLTARDVTVDPRRRASAIAHFQKADEAWLDWLFETDNLASLHAKRAARGCTVINRRFTRRIFDHLWRVQETTKFQTFFAQWKIHMPSSFRQNYGQ
ncbi:hypothetical protein NEOLEDRAFT_1065912, partial [Neolentinus lepideus HHB14362 ss-1]